MTFQDMLLIIYAGVAELADAQDLKSWVRNGRAGSSPASGILFRMIQNKLDRVCI